MACLRLVTFFPDRPERSRPRLRSRIARSTFFDAFLPYFAMRHLVARKLQSALGVVGGVHAVALLATMSPATGIRATTAFVFWLGAFTLWSGVKSHLESSILLESYQHLAGNELRTLVFLVRLGLTRRIG